MNEHAYKERHMGTDVSLSFVCEGAAMADAIAAQTFSTISDYELRFSRFLPVSELSQLNTNGTAVVSNTFIEVLERCKTLTTITAGAFNPLLQVHALGYTASFSELPNMLHVSPKKYDTTLEHIVIDHHTNTVTLGHHQQLDFGGMLKGYLAERLADRVMRTHAACHGVIINIGGDIATRGHDGFHKPFIFQLYNPITGAEIPIAITDTSLTTSGTYARTWQTDRGQKHHLVDPTTQDNPVQDLVATSIVHRDGALAEALTKLFLVTGVNKALTIAPPEKLYYQYFAISKDGTSSTNLT